MLTIFVANPRRTQRIGKLIVANHALLFQLLELLSQRASPIFTSLQPGRSTTAQLFVNDSKKRTVPNYFRAQGGNK